MSTPPIAVSTGWLFEHDYETVAEQARMLPDVDGVELSITHNPYRVDVYRTPFHADFDYCSMHLSTRMFPDDPELAMLKETHDPDAVVLHPDREFMPGYIGRVRDAGLTPALENMDCRLFGGHNLNDLEDVVRSFDTEVVFDIQHAYEHDADMGYARDLVSRLGDQLSHLHVSGESGAGTEALERHELVHQADNKETITSFLETLRDWGISVPVVIESHYTSMADLEAEIDCIRDAYCP